MEKFFSFCIQHVYNSRRLTNSSKEHMEALKFIEQEDRGVVSWLTMVCIPKEKRWSSLHKTQYLSKDFVGEEQCRIEAKTGIVF
jgi:hypothetical protein